MKAVKSSAGGCSAFFCQATRLLSAEDQAEAARAGGGGVHSGWQMAKIETSFFDIGYLDILASRESAVHRLDPRTKVLTTLVFIVCVISFGKYEISGLMPFLLYPWVLMTLGNIPPRFVIGKTLLAAPFAFCIGIFNPLMDRAVLVHLGPVVISGGWISFASIMLRFALTASAALVLVGVTGFNAVCMAVDRLGVPRIFTVQLLFLYRYIFVLADEAARVSRARSLRACGSRGLGIGVFTSMIGQMLLRTLDRAKRIHQAMHCRGFDGEIRILRPLKADGRDLVFFLGWSAFFVCMRLWNASQILGSLVLESVK